jgi:peptidyl-prolyl cis-trans isomerase B (cyclophilin B)
VATVAVEAGKIAFTPSYVRQASPTPLVAPTIDVTVTPADPAKPRLGVILETTHGALTAAFRPDVAYNTVESFASLVKKGFYDGLKFHRIIKGFMAQGGDPKADGNGGPGYCIPLETTPRPKLLHVRGVLSMARSNDPDSAGSQFFVMFATRSDLDIQYTTFGEMVDGENTLKKLENVPCGRRADPNASPPLEDVVIKSAKLVNVR